jgi:hypothetical protein
VKLVTSTTSWPMRYSSMLARNKQQTILLLPVWLLFWHTSYRWRNEAESFISIDFWAHVLVCSITKNMRNIALKHSPEYIIHTVSTVPCNKWTKFVLTTVLTRGSESYMNITRGSVMYINWPSQSRTVWSYAMQQVVWTTEEKLS